MAKVVPYACATAHGKLACSIQFKRKPCKVILMKATNPTDANTPEQQEVRDKLSDAVLRYQLLNYSEKTFLETRATQVEGNAYSLFISKYMKDQIWSRVKPIGITTVENMVIHDPVGVDLDNLTMKLEAIITNLDELDCILWNKCGSDYEVEHSEIGPDGIRVGTLEYLAAKFGSGVHDYDLDKYITFPDVHMFNKGILGHWYIPEFSSHETEAGFVSITTLNTVLGSYNLSLVWIFSHAYGQNVFFMYGFALGVRCQYIFEPVPFEKEDKLHLQWIVNYSKPPGARYRMFQNGTELNINLIPHDNELEMTSGDIMIIDTWGLEESKSTFDNIKVYPVDTYPIQIAANREFEDFSPDPISIGFYGQVEDRSNIFTPDESIEKAPAHRLVIINTGAHDIEIPFRYSVAVTWSGPGVESRTSLIRFPKMSIGVGQTKDLYLSADWSTYFDKELHNLACTNKM